MIANLVNTLNIMDRTINDSELTRQKIGKIARYSLLALGLVLSIYGFRNFLQKPVSSADIQIASVEQGMIQERISATGTVIPAFEQIVSSALSSEIQKLSVTSGSAVTKGDILMSLDRERIQNEYDQSVDALELRKNRVFRLQLELDKTLYDLQMDQKIQALQLDQQQARLQDLTSLKSVGGATAEEIKEAQLEVDINSLQQNKLRNEIEFRQKSLQSEKDNLQLEVDIQKKQLQSLKKQMDQCVIRAPRAGVVTWINENIGQQVQDGDPLVRVANLDNYRVEASCADRFADQLHPGQKVIVRINGQDLKGEIAYLMPTSENNTISFSIQLVEAEHPSLRPNQTVEVFVVMRESLQAIQLPNGPAFTGASQQEVFVVENNIARKRTIEIGLSNTDRIEITKGLNPGERVIVSKTEDYRYLDQFELEEK